MAWRERFAIWLFDLVSQKSFYSELADGAFESIMREDRMRGLLQKVEYTSERQLQQATDIMRKLWNTEDFTHGPHSHLRKLAVVWLEERFDHIGLKWPDDIAEYFSRVMQWNLGNKNVFLERLKNEAKELGDLEGTD